MANFSCDPFTGGRTTRESTKWTRARLCISRKQSRLLATWKFNWRSAIQVMSHPLLLIPNFLHKRSWATCWKLWASLLGIEHTTWKATTMWIVMTRPILVRGTPALQEVVVPCCICRNHYLDSRRYRLFWPIVYGTTRASFWGIYSLCYFNYWTSLLSR